MSSPSRSIVDWRPVTAAVTVPVTGSLAALATSCSRAAQPGVAGAGRG